MKTLFLFCLLIISLSISAQRIEKFYDYRWQPVTIDKALYYSVIEKEGDRYHRKDYFIRQNKLQMDGYYSDSSSEFKQGDFHYYYPNGYLETKSNYVNNKLNGQYISFHDNGMMKDSSFYSNGNVTGNAYGWHRDGTMSDSTVMNEDGSGVSVSWHTNAMPAAAGYYSAGRKMRGTWQFFHINGNLSAKEMYDDGKLTGKKYFDENGMEEKDTTNTDREASFPGGTKAWLKYAENHAYFPPGWQIVNSDAVVVLVTATIDEEGKVTSAFVSSPFHPAFDEIALNMMKKSPRWLPAIVHHRKIKTLVRQPVTFQQSQ